MPDAAQCLTDSAENEKEAGRGHSPASSGAGGPASRGSYEASGELH